MQVFYFPFEACRPLNPPILGDFQSGSPSKSPRIGGFRGLENVERSSKDLCVHGSPSDGCHTDYLIARTAELLQLRGKLIISHNDFRDTPPDNG